MKEYISCQKSIIEVLQKNSRGLTIGEISKLVNLNRNSVAKYLEILLISGNVEKREIGPAKLYFSSSKIPLSKLLDYSSDSIFVLDENLNILQANKNILEVLKSSKNKIIGKNFLDLNLFANKNEDFVNSLSLNSEEVEIIGEYSYILNQKRYFFKYKILKSCFDSGSCGLIVIFEDITAFKEYQMRLEFTLKFEELISEIAADFIYIKKEDIEKQISISLEKIAKVANVDATSIYLFNKKENHFFRVFQWKRPEIEEKERLFLKVQDFPRWFELIKRYEPVFVHKNRLPKDAVAERKLLELLRINSLIVYPLVDMENLVGFFTFSHEKKQRFWSKNTISLLNTTSRFFTQVLKKSGILDIYLK